MGGSRKGYILERRDAGLWTGEDHLAVEYVRIIGKIVEVLFNLAKVLGGNWASIAALALSMVELHEAWQASRTAPAL